MCAPPTPRSSAHCSNGAGALRTAVRWGHPAAAVHAQLVHPPQPAGIFADEVVVPEHGLGYSITVKMLTPLLLHD